jgi:sortase A
MKSFLSCLWLAAGAVLLLLGGREYLESRLGQSDAAREFEEPAPALPPAELPRQAARRVPYITPQRGDAPAKMVIPRLDTQLYVVEGDDQHELRRGPGHLTGTAMPGAIGNCAIAWHGDTHFRVLKDIRQGDDILL